VESYNKLPRPSNGQADRSTPSPPRGGGDKFPAFRQDDLLDVPGAARHVGIWLAAANALDHKAAVKVQRLLRAQYGVCVCLRADLEAKGGR